MKYLVDSVSEMNFNYLYIDERSLSYHELLKKFVLSEDPSPNDQHHIRERSNTLTSHKLHEKVEKVENVERPKLLENHQDKDHYYNV